ncbi:hypothetical protein BLW93_00505 [Desulfurobacterium indicum]|uniref:Uncharacterized protein n=1 Tax=Desulfurobacterium indicum TaxID=1914305 RepID=A0A1R1MNK6_9BACT|nr:hypothetical protein BLW93_00505 [Desulfurobacterium indicum]
MEVAPNISRKPLDFIKFPKLKLKTKIIKQLSEKQSPRQTDNQKNMTFLVLCFLLKKAALARTIMDRKMGGN